MSNAIGVHVAVYQVLDEVLGANVAPPGVRAAIHSIIDDLRFASAPTELVEKAEAISLQLHQLDAALGRCDTVGASAARKNLYSIASCWLDSRIKH